LTSKNTLTSVESYIIFLTIKEIFSWDKGLFLCVHADPTSKPAYPSNQWQNFFDNILRHNEMISANNGPMAAQGAAEASAAQSQKGIINNLLKAGQTDPVKNNLLKAGRTDSAKNAVVELTLHALLRSDVADLNQRLGSLHGDISAIQSAEFAGRAFASTILNIKQLATRAGTIAGLADLATAPDAAKTRVDTALDQANRFFDDLRAKFNQLQNAAAKTQMRVENVLTSAVKIPDTTTARKTSLVISSQILTQPKVADRAHLSSIRKSVAIMLG